MIRHFIVERNSQGPREWDPRNPGPDLPRDCLYFGKVLVELEKHSANEDIHCYLTWKNDTLPELGPHVIAILIGEEWGLIPRYTRHVRMVARVMSRYPFLGIRRWWPINRLTLMLCAKHVRNWIRHLRGWLLYKFPPSSWPDIVHDKGHIVHLPWGSANLVEVPMKRMDERTQDYFFSGGVAFGTDRGYRKLTGGPKSYSRECLVKAVEEIEKKHPYLASKKAIVVHKEMSTGELKDGRLYAQRMMDAKVCLAPRGTVADTWRYFEGLKSGCVVITNPLPDEWYYRGTPAIQIDHWSELEQVVIPLLADQARLEEIHLKTLRYWDDVCGEKAVGRFLACALFGSDIGKS